jgi:hypothetical protein
VGGESAIAVCFREHFRSVLFYQWPFGTAK